MLLQLFMDAYALVSLSSLIAYIHSADPACGIVKDASHSLPWQRHTSITAVNVGTELCKI